MWNDDYQEWTTEHCNRCEGDGELSDGSVCYVCNGDGCVLVHPDDLRRHLGLDDSV